MSTLEERFWSKVDKDGTVSEHSSGLGLCWVWTGFRLPDGNGRMKIDGKMYLARRVGYELQVGTIPDGMDVKTRCLNGSCVRGDHLFTGFRGDGERRGKAVLVLDAEDPAWKEVPGFPGYEAGVSGNVRSWWAGQQKAEEPKILTPTKNNRSGYYYVTMIAEDGKKRNCVLHRVILLAHRGPCPPGMEGRHFPDRDKANCRLENLSYASHQENMDDKKIHGTTARGPKHREAVKRGAQRGEAHYAKRHPEKIKRGSSHPSAKLSEADYDYVVELLSVRPKIPQHLIAAEVGCSQSQISDISTGRRKR